MDEDPTEEEMIHMGTEFNENAEFENNDHHNDMSGDITAEVDRGHTTPVDQEAQQPNEAAVYEDENDVVANENDHVDEELSLTYDILRPTEDHPTYTLQNDTVVKITETLSRRS